jgi:hypothetical protein
LGKKGPEDVRGEILHGPLLMDIGRLLAFHMISKWASK